MHKRQILLDTETTGLDPASGHRVIEIGAVEMIERRVTGSQFHRYLNPQRVVEEQAVAIHGLNNAFLADKPLFADVFEEFLAFIDGAELIIHNAPFDVKFLDNELRLVGCAPATIGSRATITDTLALARSMHPGQKNSLDALCKRYKVVNSHRTLHGALLDATILAQVYLAMTGGQKSLSLSPDEKPAREALVDLQDTFEPVLPETLSPASRVPGYGVLPAELAEHERVLALLRAKKQEAIFWDELAS